MTAAGPAGSPARDQDAREPGHAMRCPQCGNTYTDAMGCGPSHAVMAAEIRRAPYLSALVVREREDLAAARVDVERLTLDLNHAEHFVTAGRNAIVERDTALAEVARLRAENQHVRALMVAEVDSWGHTVSEDCWYTCPAATEEREGETCCNDDAGTECNCGLDLRKARILAALDPSPEERS